MEVERQFFEGRGADLGAISASIIIQLAVIGLGQNLNLAILRIRTTLNLLRDEQETQM